MGVGVEYLFLVINLIVTELGPSYEVNALFDKNLSLLAVFISG